MALASGSPRASAAAAATPSSSRSLSMFDVRFTGAIVASKWCHGKRSLAQLAPGGAKAGPGWHHRAAAPLRYRVRRYGSDLRARSDLQAAVAPGRWSGRGATCGTTVRQTEQRKSRRTVHTMPLGPAVVRAVLGVLLDERLPGAEAPALAEPAVERLDAVLSVPHEHARAGRIPSPVGGSVPRRHPDLRPGTRRSPCSPRAACRCRSSRRGLATTMPVSRSPTTST